MSSSAQRRAEQRAILRLEALVGISGGRLRCECCGERRVWTLCFDHIDGGGSRHRKENASNPTVRLVRREYRETGYWPRHRYQVLCATCNHGRRVGSGTCPHVEEVIMSTQARNALKSYIKVFLATVLGLFLSDGADVFAVSYADVRTWLSAGIASLLPLIITALDPSDPRFGKGSEE